MNQSPEIDQLAKLREPFEAGVVGKLPKLTCSACAKKECREHQKAKCRECEAYISPAHIHLDYVGHAAVTDRLLNVDPHWTWEPVGYDATGCPALDRDGNLWIRLTVCGVTRYGVGDGRSMKERIGDAIRNAAMRFGVALALWTKDELESGVHEEKATTKPKNQQPPPNRAASATVSVDPVVMSERTGTPLTADEVAEKFETPASANPWPKNSPEWIAEEKAKALAIRDQVKVEQ